MNIRISYTNHRGKRVIKDFNDPMEIIGYIYRCYAASKNAASTKRINALIDKKMEEEALAKELEAR